QVLRITNVDAEAGATLDGCRDGKAAHRRFDDRLDVADPQTVPGECGPVGKDVDVEAAEVPLVKDAPCPSKGGEDPFEAGADLLDRVKIASEHLDANGRADARGQHVDAGLDRHRPGVGPAGELHQLLHLGGQLLEGGRSLAGPAQLPEAVLALDLAPLILGTE